MKQSEIRSIRDTLQSGKTTLPEIVRDYINRIEKANPGINAFSRLHKEQALARAEKIQKKCEDGTAGPLAGVVMGIKEVLCQESYPATCASRMLESYEAVYDATVVERLNQQDAVIIGRLNMDEFAMGSSNENSIYGPVRNPHNPDRVPGGSSGGSAAAVAAGLCHATLGSDTGGSIRQPASFCGVVGLKPSYGRVSRHGLIAYASSFDCIGPLARSVTDAATILQAIAGHDPKDATSSSRPVPEYPTLLDNPDPDIKVGIPQEYFSEGLDPGIRERVMEVADRMKKQGATLVDIRLPHLKYAIAAYYVLATAEASSNLARFDGIRYGHRADMKKVRQELKAEQAAVTTEEQAATLDTPMIRLYKQSRTEGFGTEVKRRIMLGTYVLSAGYYDAYYAKAQRIRRLIKQDFEEAFSRVDVILSPTAPTTAFELGSKINDPLQMYLNDIYTISANLAGICGISVPAGKHDSDGMPIGVQFMADAFHEPELLRAARLAEIVVADRESHAGF
ncbi:MAG: Asp-tRNA(Asn)/Glu-tRNA(Gln) amidotransferase subunit GatA [Bacteroidota bacterium]